MNHFSPKSLLFYGTMIGGVVILFRGVTGYGEQNLKVPPNLSGQYISETPLPGCGENTRFALSIQQSGIYLYGALQFMEASSETAAIASVPEQPDLTLRGTLEHPSASNIALVGTIKLPATCQPGANHPANSHPVLVKIQGTVLKPETANKTEKLKEKLPAKFTGKIALGSVNPSEFTASQDLSKVKQESSH